MSEFEKRTEMIDDFLKIRDAISALAASAQTENEYTAYHAEKSLDKIKSELKLESEKARGLNSLIEQMQSMSTQYLIGPPKGINKDQFVDAIIQSLDCPEQRLAQKPIVDEITRLRAEIERLTKERDAEKAKAESLGGQLTTALVHHEAAYNDSLAAEKSRDETFAELNKALETLGQLRSDLQKAEEERDELLKHRDLGFQHANESEIREEKMEARAQSAEASLAKLREAAGEVFKAYDRLGAVAGLGRAIRDLRSLLDEPDKGGE